MNQYRIGILFFALVLITPVHFAKAQQQVLPELIENVPIRLTAEKMPPDEHGTDIENIYTFTVDYEDRVHRKSTYNVLFYLNGVYTQEFKNIQLPYRFSWNFKGQTDKTHEIRVDLEDTKVRIVARKMVSVNVTHKKKK